MNLTELRRVNELVKQLEGLNQQIDKINQAVEHEDVRSVTLHSSGINDVVTTIREPDSVHAITQRVYEQLRDHRDAVQSELLDLGVTGVV